MNAVVSHYAERPSADSRPFEARRLPLRDRRGRRGRSRPAVDAGSPLVLDDLARGRDDVPLAAVESGVPTLGLTRGRVTDERVEGPVVVRHHFAAGWILVQAEQRSLRGA